MNTFRPDLLVPEIKDHFTKKTRLVITGESFWKNEHGAGFHQFLEKNGILHHYDDKQCFPHRWSKDWMEPTLKALVDLAAAPASQKAGRSRTDTPKGKK